MSLNRQILHGDVLEKLKEIPDSSIDCIVTSPPYFSLRNYSVDGQLGLEEDYREFLKKMREIMKECYRILKNTGTCWINFGDSYAGSGKGVGGKNSKESFTFEKKPHQTSNIKSKSLIGIPQRFFIQCIDDGWVARNDIPWLKSNNMPSSKTDGFTNKHEYVYFFTKTPDPQFYYNKITGEALDKIPKNLKLGKDYEMVNCTNTSKDCNFCQGSGQKKSSFWKSVNYYFDLNSVRVKSISTDNKKVKDRSGQKVLFEATNGKAIHEKYTDKTSNVSRLHKNRNGNPNKQDLVLGANRKHTEQTISKINSGNFNIETGESLNHPAGKNPGDVILSDYTDEELLEWIKLCREDESAFEIAPPDLWYINPKPFKEAHFAVFPIGLPKRALLCGCAKQVCSSCEKPRILLSKPTKNYQKYLDQSKKCGFGDLKKGYQKYKNKTPSITSEYETVCYSKCNCNAGFKPGTVLDIFFGSGTTGVAAEQLNLNWIGIELNEKYIDIAKKRLEPYMGKKIEGFC